MAAKLVWVAAHVGSTSVLTCGHTRGTRLPIGAEVACEACMLWFTAALDQELAVVTEQLRQHHD